MATSAKKYLPVNSQGVAATHERVLLEVSQQEAALISLLLGATPYVGPGNDIANALRDVIDVDYTAEEDLRTKAARGIPFINTTNPHVLAYLGQFPGD